jgi:hypothetical protein
VSYTVEDVQRVCEAALFNSIKLDLNGKPLAGTPEAAKLKRPARPVDPKTLKPLGGNKTGFITKDPKTGKLMYQRQQGLVFPIVAWLGDPETHRKGGRYMRRRSHKCYELIMDMLHHSFYTHDFCTYCRVDMLRTVPPYL